MTKIISFCLWGDNPKYNVGAIKNAILARQIYPGWITRFYCGQSVPKDTRLALYQNDGLTEIIPLNVPGDWRMMLDRFQPINENGVECIISRDCDSRLSLREKEAVDEWLASDKSFHTMHDHPHHSVPILGGMFGIKKGLFSEMGRHAAEWARSHESRWQVDQDFLTEVVWPVVQNDTLNHDEFYRHLWGGRPFSSPRNGLEFIGATYDEFNMINQDQMNELAKVIR